MNDLIQLASQYRGLLSIVVSTLSFLVITYVWWNSISLWLKSISYRLPFIGINNRLSRRLEMDDQGWFNAEREVCNSFVREYDKYSADKEHYQQASIYLDKVGDKGITPLKWYHWLGLSVLVLIEAAGFAYVLAGFTLQDASEALQKEAAVAIAMLISALLVVLTHAMGGELYRNQQIDKVRLRWQNSPNKPNIIEPNNSVSLKSKLNHIDDNEPGWQQMANRLDKVNANFSKTWVMTIVTLIFIVIVASGATYVRGQVLEKLAIEEVQGEVSSTDDVFTFDDPFAPPAEAIETNDAADKKALQEKMSAHKKAGWTTFIILAVIFIAMQCYSIYLGFKTTFSGKESKDAYGSVHEFENVTSFVAHHNAKRDEVSRIAQSVLSHLQAKISRFAQKNSGEQQVLHAAANPTNRSFINFIKLEVLRHTQKVVLVEPVKPAPIQPTAQPAAAPVTPAAPASTSTDGEIDPAIVARVKNGDIQGLSDDVVIKAMTQIKQQKEETPEERLARLQAMV